MNSVLVLSTYPVVQPRHGGQVRLANILKAYRAGGLSVAHVAVYEEDGYRAAQIAPGDIAFPLDSSFRLYRGQRHIPLSADLLSGSFAAADDGAFETVVAGLPDDLSIIHVEQIWLWPLARRIRSLPARRNVRLVLGTQNIEAPLKADIFRTYDVTDCDDVVADIRALELEAVREADLVLAVTKSDLAVLATMGAREVLLAPNGIEPWQASDADLERWRTRLPKAPWTFYVASAHPPNFTDFFDHFGGSLGCIPPDSRLVVAGSVCEHIYREAANSRWGSLNLSRLELLFSLSDDDLAAVKTLAHAFVLPISVGGGSNIKTAEAIYSGAHVVGGKTAFRGYEEFLHLPEVRAAETGREFAGFVREALGAPGMTVREKGERERLTWEHNLSAAVSRIDALARTGAMA